MFFFPWFLQVSTMKSWGFLFGCCNCCSCSINSMINALLSLLSLLSLSLFFVAHILRAAGLRITYRYNCDSAMCNCSNLLTCSTGLPQATPSLKKPGVILGDQKPKWLSVLRIGKAFALFAAQQLLVSLTGGHKALHGICIEWIFFWYLLIMFIFYRYVWYSFVSGVDASEQTMSFPTESEPVLFAVNQAPLKRSLGSEIDML